MVKHFNSVNVFGGTGFIGSRYCERHPEVVLRSRDDYTFNNTGNPNILYLISTVDNYNVLTNAYIDIDTNLTTLIKVLENIKNSNDDDVIFNFISSWFVYGNVPLPAREDAHCGPRGFYSITKRAAEQLLISYCETFKIKYRIIRLANVIGETDTKASAKKNALQYMIGLLKKHEPVTLYEGGTMVRDFIYIDDAVDGIHHIMEKGSINEIYNLGYGQGARIGDIIYYVRDLINSKSDISQIDTKEFHKQVQANDMVLDISKLRSLGFECKVNIKDAIDKIVNAK